MSACLRLLVSSALLWLSLPATIFAQNVPADGERWKTLAAIVLPSAEQLQSDLEFLGSMIDNPDFAPRIANKLAIDGLDRTRRGLALVRTDGLEMTALVALPVTDFERLLVGIEPLVGPPERLGNELVKIGRDTRTGYWRQQADWVWLAQSASDLEELPDPAVAVALAPQGTIGGVLDLGLLPEAFRTMAIDLIRERRAQLQAGRELDLLEFLLAGGGRLTWHWTLDHPTRKFVAVSKLEFQPGSKAAQACRDFAPRLRNLTDDAPANLVWSTSIAQPLFAEFAAAIARDQGMLNDAAWQVVQDVAAEAREIAIAPAGAPGKWNILVVAGAANERLKATIAELPSPSISLSGLSPENPLTKLFGRDPMVHFAVRGESIWMGIGPTSLDWLQKAIDVEPAQAPAMGASLGLATALDVAGRLTSSAELRVALVLGAANLREGDDRMTFTLENSTENQIESRLEAGDGVLRAATLALQLFLDRNIGTEK